MRRGQLSSASSSGPSTKAAAPPARNVDRFLMGVDANLARSPTRRSGRADGADHAAKAKQRAQEAMETLQRLASTAHLPLSRGTVADGAPYDRQDLDRLHAVAERTVRQVEEAVETTVSNLRLQVETQNRELEYLRGLDPEDPHHRANAFLREGAAADLYARFDRQRAIAASVVAYQRASGREPSEGALGRLAEIATLREAYASNRQRALGASTLPEPRSRDAERLAIAARLLAESAYGFGEHGPIVLTTEDIVERTREVSRAEIKEVEFSLSGGFTLSGTETTWTYRWEEFKFATPIRDPESGDWYVWWLTAKKFSSGWEKTPLGRWVSGGAVKGDQIPEANFAP
jgi:hypothetical protein